MISWVRDRVATRWIQTRKRGDESTTSQNTEDEGEAEDDEEEKRNSFSDQELFLPKNNNEVDDDTEEEEHSPVLSPRLIKASSPHVTCPLRQQRDRPSSSPRENRKSSPTNRSARLEKHNSKLEIRKRSSVVPSSSIVVAGPSAASPRSVPHQIAPESIVTTSTNNTQSASPSHRPSSFSFLSRRFFSGSRGSRGQTTIVPVDSTTNNHPPAGSSTTYQDDGQTNDNGQQSSTTTQSPKGICTPAATATTEGGGGVGEHPTTTITGTISKCSAPANCTRGFKSSITVRVINIKGGSIDVTLPITRTGKELKLEAIGRFAVDANELQPKYAMAANNLQNSLSKYKLVTIHRRDVIDEDLTLERLGLRDKDQLLLVVKRTADDGDSASCVGLDMRKAALDEEMLLRGPSVMEIQRATDHLPPTQQIPPKVNIDDMVLQTDLQYDIRKILISLAQSSAYVIGAGPYADRLILMLKQRLINKRKSETDSLNCLLDMGFARHRAMYALQLKEFVYADALRWLIENPRQAVPTMEEMETKQLFEEIQPVEDREGMSARNATNGEDEEEEDEEDGEVDEDKKAKEGHEIKVLEAGLNSFNSRKDYIETLLEIIRIHSQRDLPVCDEMVAKLLEMGFAEEEVREALRITQNNQAAACEWLIGSRSKSLTELRDCLPPDSPILRALLASPQVQISLGNPKMLLAYLSMLENYSSMNMWLNDTDTSGVLGQILRTYHEEKHIVAINQFSVVL